MCYNIYESEPFIGYPQFTRSLIDMSATEHEEMWIDKLFFSRHAALMCGECKRQCSITLRYK
jgi:hypothetical protein